jgi:hypothetical protein
MGRPYAQVKHAFSGKRWILSDTFCNIPGKSMQRPPISKGGHLQERLSLVRHLELNDRKCLNIYCFFRMPICLVW